MLGIFRGGSAAPLPSAVSAWTLTRHRIGRRRLALDVAGNPIAFFRYGKRGPLGWVDASVIDVDPPTDGVVVGRGAAVLGGVPLHHAAARRLERMVKRLRIGQEWAVEMDQATRKAEREGSSVDEAAAAVKEKFERFKAEGGEGACPADIPKLIRAEDWAAHVQHCVLHSRRLRLSRLISWTYKALYAAIALGLLRIAMGVYRCFKNWLNFPAQQGLKNIEMTVFYPLIVFANSLESLLPTKITTMISAAYEEFLRLESLALKNIYVAAEVMATGVLQKNERSSHALFISRREVLSKSRVMRRRALFMLFLVLLVAIWL